ncbi:baseplate J/gp47 family protein [Clostridium senegalense]
MYEDKTIEVLHEELLSNISNSYAKNVGYPTFDITRSFSIQEYNLYQALSLMIDKLDVDKLIGNELTKYVSQRKGIDRKLATKAKGVVTVTGNGQVQFGDLFATPTGIRFRAIENKTVVNTADIKIEALEAGANGVVGANAITEIPITIQGIIAVTNSNATYDGYDEESDDSLRERYYIALRVPATSGNVAHYKVWSKEVVGVGDSKIVPLWNGDKTVKVIIIDSNKQPANTDLINRVQEYIDPKGTYNSQDQTWSTWGAGFGQAPTGAYCTVVSATAKAIDISVDIQELPNFTLEDVKTNIETNITNYLKEIAFKQDFVSYAKIGSIILNTTGVQDYQTLTINNGTSNIIIANEEVATLGTVIVT